MVLPGTKMVVMVSGSLTASQMQSGVPYVDVCLPKPFTARVLRHAVMLLLARSRFRSEARSRRAEIDY